jgi:drug/metabolite transporter (DMT)-like permease
MNSATLPLLLAATTAVMMAIGQTLFKLGAPHWTGSGIPALALSFLKNPYLVTAVFLYAVTILLWIYVLKHLPLSLAYPVTALSYVIVPIISAFVLKEDVGPTTIAGTVLILAGISLISLR